MIKTSRQLFAQNGYSGTTTQEIADAAGISTTLIFQHFTSKEKLFEAGIKASYGRQPLKERLNGRLRNDVDEEVFRTIAAHNFHYAHEPQGR